MLFRFLLCPNGPWRLHFSSLLAECHAFCFYKIEREAVVWEVCKDKGRSNIVIKDLLLNITEHSL